MWLQAGRGAHPEDSACLNLSTWPPSPHPHSGGYSSPRSPQPAGWGGADGGPWESKPSPGSPLAYVPHAGPAVQPAPPFCGSSPWPPDHCHLLSAVFSTPMKPPPNQETLAPCCSVHFSFFPVCPRPECLMHECPTARAQARRLAPAAGAGQGICVPVLCPGSEDRAPLSPGAEPSRLSLPSRAGEVAVPPASKFLPLFFNVESKGKGKESKCVSPQWDDGKASPELWCRAEGLAVCVRWPWGTPRKPRSVPCSLSFISEA